MSDEFLTLLNTLRVPLLAEPDVAKLKVLQKEWKHWESRELQHASLRIAEEQRATYAAFLDNPTADNEQRLMVLADPALTGTRYGLLRRAFTELRGRISAQAARIIRPAIDRALEALRAEHTRRRDVAEPVMSSKDRNPMVIEAQRALECAESIATRLLWASDGTSDKPPLELASVLMNEANELTPEDGQ